MAASWVIAKREFRHYFTSPLAYAVAAFIFLILGLFFFINIYFGVQQGSIRPDGTIVIRPLVTILIFVLPALSMRLLADEQRMGTMELLLTAPVRDRELVIGKWLGSFAFLLVILAITWVYPLIINWLASPGIDQGVLVSAYIGLALFVGAALAVGTLFSAIFSNPITAFFVTLAVLLGLWLIEGLGSGAGGGAQLAEYLSLVSHFYRNLNRGVLDLGDILYFVSLTGLSLFLGSKAIESRRWR